MAKRLEGKTILITGASSGIGRSCAQEFARTSPANLKLILTARRIDSLKQVAASITAEVGSGVQILPVQLDISNPSQVRSFISNLPTEFQEIDILVNNAGLVKGVAKAPDIIEEDMNIMFATNVTGLINMTQTVLQGMKKRGESGQGDIINIGSIAGREGYPGGSIYCATKAAVRTFTDSLRRELIATRIRVMEVDPGQVETVGFPFFERAVKHRVKADQWCTGILARPIWRRQSQSRRGLCGLRAIDTRRHCRDCCFCCWQARKCRFGRLVNLPKSPGKRRSLPFLT